MSWLPFDPALAAGIEGRRHELFRLAAPVFRAHGYRGSTIKALAHACNLSPAALYHYFPSKAAFATFLIDDERLDWESTRIDPVIDPLVQLRLTVDLVIDVLPTYLLAIDLAREIGRPLVQPELARFFGQGEAVFGRVLVAAAPSLVPDEARELARRVLAIIVAGPTMGLAADPVSVRAAATDVLRLHLVRLGVDADRFDRAMVTG
ncbi:MAG TPA: TetR/AcrR family transcriptional regulator [Candidatus Limnocylindrales bacterium]